MAEIIFLVLFLATREAVALLANDPIMSGTLIQSFRNLEHQNPSITKYILKYKIIHVLFIFPVN